MKNVKLSLLFIATLSVLLSCSKSKEEVETCEDTHSTKVTFVNSGSTALRVVVSARITPQYEPIDPLFTIDLPAGQSAGKEFQGGRYVTTWYNGCASGCKRLGNFFRDFNECNEYEEKQ